MAKKRKKNSAEKEFSTDELTARLAEACRGLVYISETDSPVKPFAFSGIDPSSDAAVIASLGLASDAPVEVYDFDDFFAKLTARKDWFGDDDLSRAEAFAGLHDLLRSELKDRRVLRVGRVRIDILAFGTAPDGRSVGFRTFAVET